MGDNPIYDFLKKNGLTTKDEAGFLKEYSDSTKARELYGFFQENSLTTKGFDDFYGEYLKKKDPDTGTIGSQVGQGISKGSKSKSNLQFPSFDVTNNDALDKDLTRELTATLKNPALVGGDKDIFGQPRIVQDVLGRITSPQKVFDDQVAFQKNQIKSDPNKLAEYNKQRSAELDEQIAGINSEQGSLNKGVYGGSTYITDSDKFNELGKTFHSSHRIAIPKSCAFIIGE